MRVNNQLSTSYTEEIYTLKRSLTFKELVSKSALEFVLLTEETGEEQWLLTPELLRAAERDDVHPEEPIPDAYLLKPVYVADSDPLSTYPAEETAALVEGDGHITGLLRREKVLRELQRLRAESRLNEEILQVVFETAYEGIAVVDQHANIVHMNDAYRSFLGITPEAEVIGRAVTDVIDNTQLHRVVETGIPERAQTQVIQGQKMIVHRIPIWRGDEITGAIGMLIFEGVSELYHILEQEAEGKTLSETAKAAPEYEDVTFENMVGESHAIQMMKSRARKASRTKATVMITGESGTGKEVFAKAIRNMSPRAKGPYVSINCAAIPDQLLEAELFGFEEGSFTGAKKGGQSGKFEQAHKGTLFLDEIGDMPLHMQTKILRVLEEESVVRVGGSRVIQLDVRIITATNQNLLKKVEEGTFRKDLYYRLNVIQLELPTLRERKEDIPALVQHYIPKLAYKHSLEQKTFTKEAMQKLRSYDWPGNIRELVNVLEQVLTLADGSAVEVHDLPHAVQAGADPEPKALLHEGQESREKSMIESVLEEAAGNKTKAAEKLGIHRTTLHKKIKRYGIEV
ncbi:sigma-54 interaction domain-containing protein [Bacillus daqingensis]|uniref:Sigma-54 interaction domain-containing protein n=1 Tax=Bacillus daqingensis TaxID=872396 RepID=A0ABV9NZ20_9BACI